MSTCRECRFHVSCTYGLGQKSEGTCRKNATSEINEWHITYDKCDACGDFETRIDQITTCKDCVWYMGLPTMRFCCYDNAHHETTEDRWCRHFLKKENAE